MARLLNWFPGNYLALDKIKVSLKYGFVVLNRPIITEREIVERLWRHASKKVTVDAGTDRWLSWMKKFGLENKLSHPDFITGDFDSCQKESFSFFNDSKIICTPDQDENDFTKSLIVLEPFIENRSLQAIIALCATSGRIDHIIGSINTLYKNGLKTPEKYVPVYILSANSLTWMLASGNHTISIPRTLNKFWCSLIPFEPTTVTTTGLKWNLKNDVMKFGGIVSTSNTYDITTDTVTVTTDKPLLWSMGISKIDD